MFAICLFIVRPIAGGGTDPTVPSGAFDHIKALLLLQPPDANGAFTSLPHSLLNGAAWTIQYEFKCYLLVLALGAFGLIRRAWVVIPAAIICLMLAAFVPEQWFAPLYRLPYAYLWLGWAEQNFRMIGLFLSGAAFYLLQRRIPLRWDFAAAAAVGLVACLFLHPIANLGLATFGAYLIFAAAQAGSTTILARINNETDISYGLYLYAWPIEQLLLLFVGGSSLLLLGVDVDPGGSGRLAELGDRRKAGHGMGAWPLHSRSVRETSVAHAVPQRSQDLMGRHRIAVRIARLSFCPRLASLPIKHRAAGPRL